MKGPVFNLPNIISLSRIPMGFAACFFLVSRAIVPTSIILIVGIFSDFLDGIIARRTNSISDWGKVFDPLADKIAMTAFIITLGFLGAVPVWFIAVALSRDILIASGGLYLTKRLGSPPASNIWGKLSTLILSIYMTIAAICYMLDTTLWSSNLIFAGLDPVGLVSFAFVLTSFFVYFSESVQRIRNI